MTINDYRLLTDGGQILIQPPQQRYAVQLNHREVLFNGPDAGGKMPAFVTLELIDLDGTTFPNDELPASPPLLTDFEDVPFTFTFASSCPPGVCFGVENVGDRAFKLRFGSTSE